MAPTIAVSDDVYEALKRRSKSWEDTPSKIIAELLGIEEKPRVPIIRGKHFPGALIEKLILFTLGHTHSGSGSAEEIKSEVLRVMKDSDLIIKEDLENTPSGRKRLEMQILMRMHDLKKAGYLDHLTQDGVWSLVREDGVMDEVREIIDSNKIFNQYRQNSDKNNDIPHPKVTYRDHRLCFKKEYIEPLNPEDPFRIVCSNGIFQMTKNKFYEVFDNIAKTSSYQDRGQYHSKNPPRKALPFKIF
jgi:hypothetical protein